MQLIYLSQDDRFFLRLTEDAVGRYPPGSFSATQNVPAYAMRVDGEGPEARTYFMVPSGDGAFLWVPATDVRLARR